MMDKRAARVILLAMGSAVVWVSAFFWTKENFGEVVWTLCFFSPFILFALFGIIYLVYVAFFEKEKGDREEWETEES